MSKRITNWKGSRRVTPSRSKVRLGWRKRRQADLMYELKGRLMKGESKIEVM